MKKLILSGALCLAVFAVAKFGYILDYRLADASPTVVFQAQAKITNQMKLELLKKKYYVAKKVKKTYLEKYKSAKVSDKKEYEKQKAKAQKKYLKDKEEIKEKYKSDKSSAYKAYKSMKSRAWNSYKFEKKYAWDNYKNAKKEYEKRKEI